MYYDLPGKLEGYMYHIKKKVVSLMETWPVYRLLYALACMLVLNMGMSENEWELEQMRLETFQVVD